jgi:hypothetical protein
MDPETSTAAVALTIKPSVDPKIAVAVGAVLLTAAGAYAFLRYRKAKQAAADQIVADSNVTE